MILKELHNEAKQKTKLKIRKHRKTILLLGVILSAFFTFSSYAVGVIQKDSLYGDLPLAAGIPIVAWHSFFAIVMTQFIILYITSFGSSTGSRVVSEYPRVVNGYWKIRSKLILPEEVKKEMADGIWYYIKLHRKHDPLYKADLDALNEKIESNKTQTQEQIGAIEAELQRQLENDPKGMRDLRISELARSKLRNLYKQSQRERDEARRKNIKYERKIVFLTAVIFKLIKIIRKLKGE